MDLEAISVTTRPLTNAFYIQSPRLLNSEPTGLLLGLAGENDRTTAGSASDYLPDHPDAGTLYAWKITCQETADPHSLTIRDDFCTLLDLDTLPDLWVAFRLYLEPGTAVGPAFAEVLYDRVIVFRPKEQGTLRERSTRTRDCVWHSKGCMI